MAEGEATILEKDLYKRLYKGANAEGWALYRIGDGTWGKKPCDLGGAGPNGEAVALEVKVVECHQPLKPLPWKRFAPHQIGWLASYEPRPHALALVGIYCKMTRKMRLFQMRGPLFTGLEALQHPHCELALKDEVYTGWNNFLATIHKETK